MKKLSTIFAAGTVVLTLSSPVLAGSVGEFREVTPPFSPTHKPLPKLEHASEATQREARGK